MTGSCCCCCVISGCELNRRPESGREEEKWRRMTGNENNSLSSLLRQPAKNYFHLPPSSDLPLFLSLNPASSYLLLLAFHLPDLTNLLPAAVRASLAVRASPSGCRRLCSGRSAAPTVPAAGCASVPDPSGPPIRRKDGAFLGSLGTTHG